MSKPNNINIPSGLELRHWDNGKVTLRVSFTYRGIRCRETLNLEPTPANIKYATNLRGEIRNAITKGTFNYPEYFPRSKRARRFGYHHAKVTVAQLLQEYLAQAKHTLEYSSYINYVKVARKHLIPAFGELPIRELTHTTIRRWLIGQTFTAKTAKNILIPLKHVIHNALLDELITHNPKLNKPWQTDKQIRESYWRPLLKAANVPYRNPYQTRHTYASMMLTKGENILWLAKQMGHVDIEMIIKTYGKWLPDSNQKAGYQPVHDWLQYAS